MLVATGAIIVGFVIGGFLGMLAGYFGGKETKLGAVIVGALVGAIFGLIIGGVFFAVVLNLDDNAAGLLGVIIGGVLGGLAGFRKGDLDVYLTGIFNVMLSVPAIVLALSLTAFLLGSADDAARGGGMPPELVLIIAIGVVSIPLVGRISRASALSWTATRLRARRARAGRQERPDHEARAAPERAAGHVLDLAARHRDRHRRRGDPRDPRCRRPPADAVVGQHHRPRPRQPLQVAAHRVRGLDPHLLHRARA